MSRRLHVLTSDRLDALVSRLAADLGAAPLAPLDADLVVVQSQGMRRWLQLELARRHGCSASLRLPFPARFCRDLIERLDPASPATDADGRFDLNDDPFDRDVMTWRILDLLEGGLADETPFEPLRRFCEGGARQRLGLAARVAGTFDDYLLYRPALLAAWEAGDLVYPGAAHEHWQAELWRRLYAGAQAPHAARRLTDLVATLESRVERPLGLPERVAVFGVSSLPPTFIALLRAIGRFIPVTCYLSAVPPRSEHPLAHAWGDQARQLFELLDGPATGWERVDASRPTGTVLGALQHAIVTGAPSGGDGLARAGATTVPEPSPDPSLQVHVCHSPLREMEVLRDQILDAFDADPSLRPHEILVMVPDIGSYHPYIEAVFGATGDGPALPYHVADRPLAREFSLARHVLDLLALADGRRTAGEVLALLDAPAIRRSAGIAEADVPLLHEWADGTRIRWATDGAERKALFGLPHVDANTWRAGLDRLLMGYAAGPVEHLVAGILPHGGDTAGDAALLGRFAGWADGLFVALDGLRSPRPLTAWRTALLDLLDHAVMADGDTEERALEIVRAQLETLARMQVRAGHSRPVPLEVVRDWLATVLSDDSLGSGFLTGGVTFAALKPMRAIPFKLVAMAGLDDASFPRHDRPRAFDLIAAAPAAGDRSIRGDDRQLFLDTLMAAERRLILSYVGRSATDNSRRAASVVLAELLDEVDVVPLEHRLQPFSPEYYRGDARLFSYSAANAGACAAVGAEAPPPPFVTGPIDHLTGPLADLADAPGDPPLIVSLAELIECWVNPSRFWCRRVLRLRLPESTEPPDDHEPFDVDDLVRYTVKADMVRRRVRAAGVNADPAGDPAAECALVTAAGDLPPAALAPAWHRSLAGETDRFMDRVGAVSFIEPVSLDVRGDGWMLTGRVDNVTDTGRLQFRPAKLKVKDRARGWIGHVALAAQLGERSLLSRVVAEDGEVRWSAPVDPVAILADLVAGYRAALRSPLPVFENASWEFGRRRRSGDPFEAALKRYRAAWNWRLQRMEGDAADPHVALCWRGRDPLGGDAAEFRRWSSALWAPACEHEARR